MLLVRDENNIRGSFSLSSLSNCSSFILIVLKVSVWQDSSWSDMSAFSGETTTTNGFDGRLLSFPVRATSTAICWNLVDNRDKRFPMPVRHARRFVYVIGLHAVQFGNNWMKKIPRTAKIGRGRRPSPIWLPDLGLHFSLLYFVWFTHDNRCCFFVRFF